MAKPAAGEQMAGNLGISQACRLQNPNDSISFRPHRHIQHGFIQETVQIALAILNSETADRTPRQFKFFKKYEVRVALSSFSGFL